LRAGAIGQRSNMRDKVVSAITWTAIIGLGIADADGFRPAKYIVGVLTLIWLACVAVPWLWSERPPPWRKPALTAWPPARWALLGLASLAVMLVGCVLVSGERKPTLAIVLTIVGATGLFAFSWIAKREQQR
jgi:hypothetical protein